MEGLKDSLTNFVLDPANHDLLAIIKGFRNGVVYGTKIRFPHALVMTFLFRNGSLKDHFTFIFKATKQHARNLAFFVTIYKTLMLLQRKASSGKEAGLHPFLAGLIGGYLVFGENNNINNQIVLYLFSRIMVGFAKMPVSHELIDAPRQTFSIFASLVWGIVMWQFWAERDVLQPSLQASMQYLYIDSNKWDGLKNFLWHNK